MRTIKSQFVRHLLLLGLGLLVAVIVFAGTQKGVPERPGRPSAYDIEADWAMLMFRKPKDDGGAPIQKYCIEYLPLASGRWMLDSYIKPEYSVSDRVDCRITNRVGTVPVSFRVYAVNQFGESPKSDASDPITFKSPY